MASTLPSTGTGLGSSRTGAGTRFVRRSRAIDAEHAAGLTLHKRVITNEAGYARPCHANAVRVEPGIDYSVCRRGVYLLADRLHGVWLGERCSGVQQAGINPVDMSADQGGIIDRIKASTGGIK